MRTFFRIARVCLAISPAALWACAPAWRSEPIRTQADFGNSVSNMIAAQTADPARIANPDLAPVHGLSGDKSASVYAEYRKDVSKPKQVERPININVSSSGGR